MWIIEYVVKIQLFAFKDINMHKNMKISYGYEEIKNGSSFVHIAKIYLPYSKFTYYHSTIK